MNDADVAKLERAAKTAKRKGDGGDLLAYWDSLRAMWRLCTPGVIPELLRVSKGKDETIRSLREALTAVEFNERGYCQVCNGWNRSPFGATRRKHTKNCALKLALAAHPAAKENDNGP